MKKRKSISSLSIDKFTISIIGITLFLLIGVILLAGKLTYSVNIEPDSQTKAKVEKLTHDWGEINMNDGNVEAEFTIKNDAMKPLKLFNVVTSCMCTTAQLVLGNHSSPRFGMHSKSDYILEIPPGESAKLEVVFDPAYHGPSGIGPITRQVNISTNDRENPLLTFVLTANVTR